MVDGEHKFVMEYTGDKIARALGKTLVAPVVTYVPEGSWENPAGHMAQAGHDHAARRSLRRAARQRRPQPEGRRLQDHPASSASPAATATACASRPTKLNELWKGSDARAFWIDDYYTKAHADQNKYVTEKVGIPADQIGGHANILDTSELLFVNPKHIRRNRLTGNDYENNGVSGNNQSKSTPELGKAFLQIKIDNALAQIKALMAGTMHAAAVGSAGERRRRRRPRRRRTRRRGRRAERRAPARLAGRRWMTAPASKTPTQAPDTVFIDELTWEETRDAMKAGKTTVIVPTGGTEKNGYHMVIGKHNYVVTYAANLMARRLKNALVAPTIQYVPEGDPDRQNPGAISLPSPAYDMLLDAAARSLKVHGFTEILFIGDSGGNQAGMTTVADKLNEEWKDAGVKVFALTDYYEAEPRCTIARGCRRAFGYDDDDRRQPRRHHRHVADAVRPAGRRPQGSDQAVGRPAGLRRVRRSGEGDGRDRQDGHRVQGERRHQPVQAAEEPACARDEAGAG